MDKREKDRQIVIVRNEKKENTFNSSTIIYEKYIILPIFKHGMMYIML